jgi:hypothetical protein
MLHSVAFGKGMQTERQKHILRYAQDDNLVREPGSRQIEEVQDVKHGSE